MKLLEERIREDGLVLPGNVLKVNSFLNHQLDPDLLNTIGQEFAHLYRDDHITRILTVESSGIAPAIMTGLALHVPVLFARKVKSSTMNDSLYTADVYSYTKKVTNKISVDQKFLLANDNILIIDDFLANGQAVSGLLKLCDQAGAHVAGAGIVIEKSFQAGGKMLRARGLRLDSLARISSFDNGQVHFVGK